MRQLRPHRGHPGHHASRVEEGEIVTLIGANGAGKTTTMKTVSGLRPVREGTIMFDGKDITDDAGARAGRAGHLPVARGPRRLPRA